MPDVQTIVDHLRLFRPNRLRAQGNDWYPLTKEAQVALEPKRLRAFLQVCPGWDDVQHLPPTYPQLAAAHLHLGLLGEEGFPFHPMGLVHVSNHIEQFTPLRADTPMIVRASVSPGEPHSKGRLINVRTEVRSESGDVLWQSLATAIKLAPNQPRTKSKNDDADRERWRSSDTVQTTLKEDLGRRYGAIAGDLNPIHQRAWLAKPFGFPRHIIHGTWTLAWAIHPLLSSKTRFSIDARFRRPVSLPATLHRTHREDADGLEVRAWTESLWKPSLEINLRF